MAHQTLIPTIDPTLAGMEPGRGPLRVGGRPGGTGISARGDRPDTRSPASEAQQQALQLCRDLYGGNETVKNAAGVYLPREPGETPANYQIRLHRSVFFNVFKQSCIGLVGLIFRRDPVLGDDVPALIREHWENLDNAGTHGDVLLKELAEEALQVGHAAILVEYPKAEPGLRLADEKGLRPYWVPIKKEDLISWRSTTIDGVQTLTQVVIRIRRWIADGMFGEALETLYHVIRREPAAVTWQLLQLNKDHVVELVDEGVYRNQEDIPLAEVKSAGRRSLFESSPPLLDLGFLNLAHYQMWSDYATSIHKTCVPLLALIGIERPKDSLGNPQEIVIGANTVLTISNPAGKVQYASHNGEALGNVKTALDDLKSDMGVLGLAMLAPQKRVAETAEAKRMDKATTDSALSVTARGLQDAAETALIFHARYMGLEAGGSVEVNRDFEGLLLDAPVMQAYAALVNAGFPPRIVLKSLQEGGRIPEDEDLDSLLLEMEADRVGELERRELQLDNDGLAGQRDE